MTIDNLPRSDSGGDLGRRGFLQAFGAGLAATVAPDVLGEQAASKRGSRPNILFIMADDLGAECLGCYGGTSYKTPHLDALARTGIRFAHGHSTPLCSPSRVQVMTGRYPFRTGWPTMINARPADKQFLDPRERTFGHVLKAAGYATALAGKWQLCHFEERPDHVRQCGFDDYCCWMWRYKGKKTHRYWSPAIWQDGKPRQDVRDRYGPDVFCDSLIDFMTRNRSRPFLAYYPMTLTHGPFLPTPDTKRAGREGKKRRGGGANYAAMVAYMDKLVGKLVAALDRLGLRENTLILFTGDNGTPRQITSKVGAARIQGGKGKMTEAGTHVPLIANWKGTAPGGRVCEDLVDFSDMMPTFAELAGADLSKGAAIDGRSFAPQLRGRQGAPREWIYCQLGKARWVRTVRWKLYATGKLYDMKADPTEAAAIAPGTGNEHAEAARKRLGAILATLK